MSVYDMNTNLQYKRLKTPTNDIWQDFDIKIHNTVIKLFFRDKAL